MHEQQSIASKFLINVNLESDEPKAMLMKQGTNFIHWMGP